MRPEGHLLLILFLITILMAVLVFITSLSASNSNSPDAIFVQDGSKLTVLSGELNTKDIVITDQNGIRIGPSKNKIVKMGDKIYLTRVSETIIILDKESGSVIQKIETKD